MGLPAVSVLSARPRLGSFLATGLESLDGLVQGLPCGAIAEITGAASAGCTSLALACLAAATDAGNVCAYVDASDSFDPSSGAAAGVLLPQLVWVRCHNRIEHALKSADLLIHGGGFGLVLLDLRDVPPRLLERMPLSWWHRFRRAIENTPTVLLVLSREPQAKSTASLLLDLQREEIRWSGAAPSFRLLRSLDLRAAPRKPVRAADASLRADALA